MFFLYFLTAVLSGIIGGMGMGGGTILIPFLTIIFGVEQKASQALNLISFIPMAVFAVLIHKKNGLIRFKEAIWCIIPALLTCTAGCFLAKIIKPLILRKIFGAFLICLSVFELIKGIKTKKARK